MPFFKRTTALFDRQLDLLAQKVVAAAEGVGAMLEKPEEAEARAEVISDLEHQADRIVRETIALQGSNLGSVERRDLNTLLDRVDDIVDVADAAGQTIWLHQLGEATDEVKEQVRLFIEASQKVRLLMAMLRDQREPHEVLELCVEINRLENEGDAVYRQTMLSLFSGKYDAMHIAKWKDLYERLERGIDKCQDVAILVEGLVQAIA